jgi:hypothetical protein
MGLGDRTVVDQGGADERRQVFVVIGRLSSSHGIMAIMIFIVLLGQDEPVTDLDDPSPTGSTSRRPSHDTTE